MGEVTRILGQIEKDGPSAAEDLFLLAYSELRQIAAGKMAREQPGQTLQPTALVHEAWLRLGGESQPSWENRAHFFAAAAEAMRRILVERARRKLGLKREGGRKRVELDELDIAAPAPDERMLQVHDALEALAAEDPRKAEIVKLRFFVGLGNEEIAGLLGLNEKTVRRHWEVAKALLFEQIKKTG